MPKVTTCHAQVLIEPSKLDSSPKYSSLCGIDENCLQGLYEKAWDALVIANQLQKDSLSSKGNSQDERLLKALTSVFPLPSPQEAPSPTYEALLSGAGGFWDETPVFIVGMPRSGSTLVEQILASHPEVVGAGSPSKPY